MIKRHNNFDRIAIVEVYSRLYNINIFCFIRSLQSFPTNIVCRILNFKCLRYLGDLYRGLFNSNRGNIVRNFVNNEPEEHLMYESISY